MTILQSAPWVPNARKVSGQFTDSMHPKLLLHATIAGAMALPDYADQSMAPNVTIRWDGSKIIPNQHYYWNQFSKALRNLPGGVETNRDGARQVELAGFLDDRPGEFNILKAPDEYWRQVGNFLKPVVADLKIPNVVPLDWTTKGRMSLATWDNFSGICAHVHVPENDHWDLPIPAHALSVLQNSLYSTDVPRVIVPSPIPNLPINAPKFPLYTGHYFGTVRRDPKCHSGTYSAVDRGFIRMWQSKMKSRGWNIAVDGVFNQVDANIAKQFQQEKRLGADGLVGPATWAATWAAPVT